MFLNELTDEQCVSPGLLSFLSHTGGYFSTFVPLSIKHTDVSEQDLTSDLEAIRVRVLRACEIITS